VNGRELSKLDPRQVALLRFFYEAWESENNSWPPDSIEIKQDFRMALPTSYPQALWTGLID
jgi:hypothetical protein